jgi:CDP-paratose 2-epimerase
MKTIITGGAGFIGSNAAVRYLKRGAEVVIVDNFHRPGTRSNLKWVESHGRVRLAEVDIRDGAAVEKIFRANRDASLVLHLAGQVAVTASLVDPRFDFETNALGTLNVLEAMRAAAMECPLIYSSTNKVYGEISEVAIVEQPTCYEYANLPYGVSEDRLVDFHSPYGCSKGTADQYVRDYYRVYGVNGVVFRQSCIYGTQQFGSEDQGWIAWFLIAAELGLPLTIYGNGKQVRDVLYIDDLLDAFDAAVARIEIAKGNIYNIGGGTANAISLLELIDFVSKRRAEPLGHSFGSMRTGDQLIYVSDIRRAAEDLNWKPRVGWHEGVDIVSDWVRAHSEECRRALGVSGSAAAGRAVSIAEA